MQKARGSFPIQFSPYGTGPEPQSRDCDATGSSAAALVSCQVKSEELALVSVSIWLMFVPGVVFIQFANSKWQQDEIVKSI